MCPRCRVLSWWDPLAVYRPAGETRLTGEDPVLVLPPGAKLGFPEPPPTPKLSGRSQRAPALPHAAQISKVTVYADKPDQLCVYRWM